ncbi:hypothetical protein [Abyssogena phaseoliformis symbiont]|uniref:hypothetical protein n=1 Tax=Abyssogena phaseoliformis symbiont TaxID=596095 RepID=UPI00191537B8|nr:hypothetical protein [Abyssogena phaseoliformis symbiont]MBW5289622.1 hypothetical protein [Candidatus Ruthia sp. Apha_13_S6]
MNKVDCSDKRIAEIEKHIEECLGIIEVSNVDPKSEISEINNQEFDEVGTRGKNKKLGRWIICRWLCFI